MIPIERKLKQIRMRRGLVHVDMAKLLGVTGPAYTNRETGKTALTQKDILILAKELNFDYRFFFEEMDIEVADLNGKSQTIMQSVQKKLNTLDPDSLGKVNNFIDTL